MADFLRLTVALIYKPLHTLNCIKGGEGEAERKYYQTYNGEQKYDSRYRDLPHIQ